MFPKSQKLSPTPAALARQDTIDETNEDSKSLRRQALERQVSERENATAAQREPLEKASSIERETTSARTTSASDTYDNGLREQSSTLAQRDLIATVLDLKADSRLEMQRMSQRIGRLEDLLTELVKRLSPNDSSDLSTPADETIPIITTTFVGSPPISTSAQSSSNIIMTTTATASSATVQSTGGVTSPQQSSSSSGINLLLKI